MESHIHSYFIVRMLTHKTIAEVVSCMERAKIEKTAGKNSAIHVCTDVYSKLSRISLRNTYT